MPIGSLYTTHHLFSRTWKIHCPSICCLNFIGFLFAQPVLRFEASRGFGVDTFRRPIVLLKVTSNTTSDPKQKRCCRTGYWFQTTYPPAFNQFAVAFYLFLFGSPIAVGIPYEDSLNKLDSTSCMLTLSWVDAPIFRSWFCQMGWSEKPPIFLKKHLRAATLSHLASGSQNFWWKETGDCKKIAIHPLGHTPNNTPVANYERNPKT